MNTLKECITWARGIAEKVTDEKVKMLLTSTAEALEGEAVTPIYALSLISELADLNHKFINRKRPSVGVMINSIIKHLTVKAL